MNNTLCSIQRFVVERSDDDCLFCCRQYIIASCCKEGRRRDKQILLRLIVHGIINK